MLSPERVTFSRFGMGGIGKYVVQRLSFTIPMVFILVSVVFLLLRIMPGDPVLAMLGGRNVSPELIAQKRHEMGLDRPLGVQYVDYIWNILHGDFGKSSRTGRPVLYELFSRLPATVELAIWGMFFAALFGLSTGIWAAVRADRPIDHTIRIFHIGSFALPIFWVGLMLQMIFAVKLGWLPVAKRVSGIYAFTFHRITGFYVLDAIILRNGKLLVDVLKHLVLPAVTLGIAQTGLLGRMTRAAMLEVLDADYITTARSKGLRERLVVMRHALKNALIPIITVFGLQFAILMGGAVLTETVFSWPGVAGFLVRSLDARDWFAIQGTIVFIGIFIATINLIVDILYSFIDPRVRY
ncbi:MAG TPA: ABC transporter permease [Candidatus Acetothermia bacterium]|nr:ABC transporter permease [Candidatus Acetothermia bacterium]